MSSTGSTAASCSNASWVLPELLALVEKTKFRKVPGYGIKGPGHIVLQHHGSPVWFRNIKIRELPSD